jgi:hypothetical protein
MDELTLKNDLCRRAHRNASLPYALLPGRPVVPVPGTAA